MKIPYQVVEPETLTRMIEELVTRAGTDYGELELTLEQKVAQVILRLKAGEAEIHYDEEQETCEIIVIGPT